MTLLQMISLHVAIRSSKFPMAQMQNIKIINRILNITV